ncbi:MAG: DNA repair protein RecO [Gemmatimonadaceae bacterium]|nr:DNA repair protein RecO [Gemmatimonadaceae bacterium]
MPPLVTEAIVLHAFDYLETSRIIRLMTRDAGIQSVLARGARNSRKRFGNAVDLFAQGTAEIHFRPDRELQSLNALEVTRSRSQMAQDVGRFTAGSMIAELAMRCTSDEPAPGLFDAVEMALDRIVAAAPDDTVDAALSGAWHMVATLGFTPALDLCANCHSSLDPAATVAFSHSAGGAVCASCAAQIRSRRELPRAARTAIRHWIAGGRTPGLTSADARAHQRLLREFFREHLGIDREMQAYRIWEQGAWTAA